MSNAGLRQRAGERIAALVRHARTVRGAAALMVALLCLASLAVLAWFQLAAADARGLERLEALRAVHARALESFGDGVGTTMAAAVRSPSWKSGAATLSRIIAKLDADGTDLGATLRQSLLSPQAVSDEGTGQANYRWVVGELRDAFATLIGNPGVDELMILRRADARIVFDSRDGVHTRLGQTLPGAIAGFGADPDRGPWVAAGDAVSPAGQVGLTMAVADRPDASLVLVARLSADRIVALVEAGAGGVPRSRVSLLDANGRVYVPGPAGEPMPPEDVVRRVAASLRDGRWQGRLGDRLFAVTPVRLGRLELGLAVDSGLREARADAWTRIGAGALWLLGFGLLAGFGFDRLLRGAGGEAPLGAVQQVVDAAGAGRFDLRTGWGGPAGEAVPAAVRRLGTSIDRLLDGPVADMVNAQRESDSLNDSVIEIMRAVGTIATNKDLTIRVPVTEDVTGAVSDALNLLTDETARAFRQVSEVAKDVARATIAVRGQADRAGAAARAEQREVDLAARELAAAAQALTAAAELGRRVDRGAAGAVAANEAASSMVERTGAGVAAARMLISDTEKQIKRLGERSQEIGQILSIIRSIADRTGILALNASMHASASDSGTRGFGSVADEVKRLSNAARDSTERISHLVSAIQADTARTIEAMNGAIAQVVEITRLSERARAEMLASRTRTLALADDVNAIAQTTERQARASDALKERAERIKRSSAQTARELEAQLGETHRLADCARALLAEVSVFKVSP